MAPQLLILLPLNASRFGSKRVQGILRWNDAPPSSDVFRPGGFYCHRFVLASDEESAANAAFVRVRANLDRVGNWLSDGTATLILEVEDISKAPLYMLLKPINRGHTFYEQI